MLSNKLLDQFAESVFTPLKRGECVTCMFVAGGGKRTLLKYFLSDKTTIKSIFEEQYSRTLFVYVDPDEITNVTTEAYIHLLLNQLVHTAKDHKIEIALEDTSLPPLIQIKKYLEKLCLENWSVVFILNDFEFTLSLPINIHLNLESIMAVNKSKIVYLFLSTVNLFSEHALRNFHNLKYAISRKVVYFPLFTKEESLKLLEETSNLLNINLSQKNQEAIYTFCGGHPQLLKYSVYSLKEMGLVKVPVSEELISKLKDNNQLKMVCADIWHYLNDKEKEIINMTVSSATIVSSHKEEEDYLLSLGVIKIVDKKYFVFGTLFEDFVKTKLPKHKMTYDAVAKKLFCNQINCDEKFTHQEFKLLVYFLTHENEVITRDQVAEAMWGKLYLEKYSDWSIDKTISVLRKKLDTLGFPSEYLVTLKKRGFSFSNPL